MSNGKLKAQYNRVRTSVALQGNSMWNNIIGVDQEAQTGSNAVIEASLKAPRHGARGRQARREAAQALILESGYKPTVSSFEGLVALARAQGSIATGKRGACRICGGMGHMTKQCKNHLSSFYQNDEADAAINVAATISFDSDISLLSSDSDSNTLKKRKRRKDSKEKYETRSRSHRKKKQERKEAKRRQRRKQQGKVSKRS